MRRKWVWVRAAEGWLLLHSGSLEHEDRPAEVAVGALRNAGGQLVGQRDGFLGRDVLQPLAHFGQRRRGDADGQDARAHGGNDTAGTLAHHNEAARRCVLLHGPAQSLVYICVCVCV